MPPSDRKRAMPSVTFCQLLRAPDPTQPSNSRAARSIQREPAHEPMKIGGPPAAAGHVPSCACAHALARPQLPHRRQVLAEAAEARRKVHAERGEVRGRRARPDAEQEPPAGHEVRRQDPVREVHGVPEGDLQDAGAQLDPARHRGRHGERDERVGQEESAADRVEDPRAVEPGRLDAARPLGEALRLAGSGGRPPRADRPRLPSAGRSRAASARPPRPGDRGPTAAASCVLCPVRRHELPHRCTPFRRGGVRPGASGPGASACYSLAREDSEQWPRALSISTI